jgi:hypothetical protein
MFTRFCWGKLNEREHFEYIDVDGNTIFKIYKLEWEIHVLYRILKPEDWSGWAMWFEWRILDYQRRF